MVGRTSLFGCFDHNCEGWHVFFELILHAYALLTKVSNLGAGPVPVPCWYIVCTLIMGVGSAYQQLVCPCTNYRFIIGAVLALQMLLVIHVALLNLVIFNIFCTSNVRICSVQLQIVY